MPSLLTILALLASAREDKHKPKATSREDKHKPKATSSTSHRRLPPIPCREDLAIVAETHFRQIGRAAEVGVYRGFFAKHNLQGWRGEYHMIDYWGVRPNETVGVAADNFMGPNDRAIAEQNIAQHRSRVKLVQALSSHAAATYPPAHFDWVYVDALHTYEAVLADLRAWWPTLRPGGLFSGDDYGDDRDTPFVTARRWAEYYGKVAHEHRWGTIRAALQFSDEVDRQLFVTWMKPGRHNRSMIDREGSSCYAWPAWYMIK